MKFFKLTIVVLLSTLFVTSCSKGERIIDPEPQRSVGGTLTIGAQLHRKTEERPRDHKNCGCNLCFGVCDFYVEVDITLSNVAINTNTGSGTSTLYILEDASQAELEFGVDEDMPIPGGALYGTGFKTFIVKKGLYNYVAHVEQININGTSRTSYGYVVVDTEYTE